MKPDTPEHELLRLCVRRRLAPTDEAHIVQLLERGPNWPYLLDMGARHKVLPLLNECLVVARPVVLPRAALKALAWRVKTILLRNRHLARELVRLHRCARTAGIRMLSFKGPVLATTVYGDLGLRQFDDLDLLVDAASFASAEKFFAALGYHREKDYGYEVTLVNNTTGVSVDLHRALSPDNFPVSVSFPRLWERREIVGLDGGDVETFSARDRVIAICIDAVKDARAGKTQLGKVSDLAHVFRAASKTDWIEVETEARQLGLLRVLSFATRLATAVLEIQSSGYPKLIVRPPRLATFLREAEEALFDPPNRRPPTQLHGDLFHFHVRERWRDKLRPYALNLHRIVTPNVVDRGAIVLPSSLSFLYYLVRLLRLTHKYGARLMRATTFDRRPSPSSPNGSDGAPLA